MRGPTPQRRGTVPRWGIVPCGGSWGRRPSLGDAGFPTPQRRGTCRAGGPSSSRERGRPRTRHLARKVGILDAQNTWESHTPPSPPFFACVIQTPRSVGPGVRGPGVRRFAAQGVCRANSSQAMCKPTRQRPRHRAGLPRAAKICGGRLPRCRATAVLPPNSILAKLRLNARFGVSSAYRRRTGGPVLEPTRGRPRHRDGLPRAARICGGRLPRCCATTVLPPSGVTPKCGWTRVSAFRRRTGSPIARGCGCLPRGSRCRCRAPALARPAGTPLKQPRVAPLPRASAPQHSRRAGGKRVASLLRGAEKKRFDPRCCSRPGVVAPLHGEDECFCVHSVHCSVGCQVPPVARNASASGAHGRILCARMRVTARAETEAAVRRVLWRDSRPWGRRPPRRARRTRPDRARPRVTFKMPDGVP